MSDPNHTPANEPLRPALVPETLIAIPRVCLDCGDFGLLLPATDLVSLTTAQQVIRREGDVPETCGSVLFQDHHYLIFCLNNTLQLQQQIAEPHTTIALLHSDNHHFGITCLSLTKLEGEASANYAIPPSMSSRRQPFNEFVVMNNRAWGLTSAAVLLDLLQGLLKTCDARIQPQNSTNSSIRRGASL
jgi:hypothetical protein